MVFFVERLDSVEVIDEVHYCMSKPRYSAI